jgi:uncharacterized protein (DUF1501 family)
MIITRRNTLMLTAAGAAALTIPSAAFSANLGANRFVFIILRGGMDGLSAAPPIGDPNYERARKGLIIQNPLKIDTTFALHPNLKNLHAMAQAKELILIHAAATPYRERSHFDAQNVLETGAGAPFARGAGWLNAALQGLPKGGRKELGVALSNQAPLVLRGDAPVATWSPSVLPSADGDTISRLMALYRAKDPALASALQSAAMANGVAAEAGAIGGKGMGAQPNQAVAQLAKAAAGFLKQPDGPMAAVIEIGGWDTHTNQGLDQGALARNLAALDMGVAALKRELGPLWKSTAVLIATEFGRTVAMNGGAGTDHGTAAAAFLVGGAVKGGRSLSDWPGLGAGQLFEARDLKPTTDIRAVMKGVLRDHLGVPEKALGERVFPGSIGVKPIDGLMNA